jgi:hypothetical protein
MQRILQCQPDQEKEETIPAPPEGGDESRKEHERGTQKNLPSRLTQIPSQGGEEKEVKAQIREIRALLKGK